MNTKVKSYESRVMSYSSKGFTLTELMIAIVITALATAAVYSTFIIQQRSFTSQDQVAETQVSSKIAFDMIVNDIRNAGFGYPADKPNINGFTDSITDNDSGSNSGPDTVTLVGGFRQIATLSADAVVGQNQISISYSGSNFFNLTTRNFISIDGLDFAQITNCIIPTGSTDCASSNPLTLDRGINRPFPTGRPVYLVENVTYQINAGNLQRVTSSDTDTIANNIDDLQFAYGIDTDDDGAVNSYVDNFQSTEKVITVRVSLLARTANQDQTLAPSTKPYFSTGITLENNNTPDTDRFRRRIWSMDVALRNPR